MMRGKPSPSSWKAGSLGLWQMNSIAPGTLSGSIGEKKLRVDLCGVTQADAVGKHVLADIHQATGAEFLADTPLTKFLAQEARRQYHADEKEN